MKTIKEVLMNRDGITESEADDLISNARMNLMDRIENGEDCEDFCMEEFGLEPDYLEELIFRHYITQNISDC